MHSCVQELLDATFARENLTQSLLDLPEHVVGCVMGNLERLLNASPAILSTGQGFLGWGALFPGGVPEHGVEVPTVLPDAVVYGES
jgi:hypothetical protein